MSASWKRSVMPVWMNCWRCAADAVPAQPATSMSRRGEKTCRRPVPTKTICLTVAAIAPTDPASPASSQFAISEPIVGYVSRRRIEGGRDRIRRVPGPAARASCFPSISSAKIHTRQIELPGPTVTLRDSRYWRRKKMTVAGVRSTLALPTGSMSFPDARVSPCASARRRKPCALCTANDPRVLASINARNYRLTCCCCNCVTSPQRNMAHVVRCRRCGIL